MWTYGRRVLWVNGRLVQHDNLPIGNCGCADFWRHGNNGELTGGWCDCRRRAAVAHSKRSKPNGLERRNSNADNN